MSKCMTIDETIDQKETCTEIAPKDIVDFILEEVLHSVFLILDKGFSRIGDFNITDDFRQQYDQLPHVKDFEQVNHSKSQSEPNQETNPNSGQNIERSARENLESLIDSFVKKEEIKPGVECTVITEEVLANNELQIQNGKIHLEKPDKTQYEPDRNSYYNMEDIVKNEKIEIEYYNEGKLNKIYVPLNPISCCTVIDPPGSEQKEKKNEVNLKEKKDEMNVREEKDELSFKEEKDELSFKEEKDEMSVKEEKDEVSLKEETERPFEPLTTEELRQVWRNGNSSLVGKWDGDVLAQREEAIRIMEKLSSAHVLPDSSADPNRPRACAFAEEDVKKIIKEIEEISFTQSHINAEDSDLGYYPDGQGDADLESKSFTKSKDKVEKPQQESFKVSKTKEEPQGDQQQEIKPPEILTSSRSEQFSSNTAILNFQKPSEISYCTLNEEISFCPTDDVEKEEQFGYEVTEDELQLNSNLYNEVSIRANDSVNWVCNSTFGADQSSEKLSQKNMEDVLTPTTSERKTLEKSTEFHLMNSIDLIRFHTDRRVCAEFLPETASLSGNVGSMSGSKMDEFTLKNMEPTSELDLRIGQGRRSDLMKMSRSANDTQDMIQESNYQIQQSAISLGRMNSASAETHKFLTLQSAPDEKKSTEPERNNQDSSFLQESDSWASKNLNGTFEDDHGFSFIVEKMNERLEEVLTCVEKSSDNLECLESDSNVGSKDTEAVTNVYTLDKAMSKDSNKSLNNSNSDEINKESLASSETSCQTQSTDSSAPENGVAEFPETSDSGTQKFKLHSQKMYWAPNDEVSGLPPKSFALTDSEEAFIDTMESVIQIIEPSENDTDENTSKVSFSLLSEIPSQKNTQRDNESEPEIPLEKDLSETENLTRSALSGMTTIGPMKNLNYDPRDLTAGEIDYGKMTRITSSRQLTKEIGMFGTEITTIKILEEEYFDENASVNTEDDRVDRNSLVNRDIASLTKVQKVREVMSYQPRLEEDFEDDEPLTRPRLDLKDVESMTDERYKVPDLGIPLLSFEIGENNSEAEAELMDSMGLVISGLTNPAYYDDEEDVPEIPKEPFSRGAQVESKSSETMRSKSVTKETAGEEKSLEDRNKTKLAQKEGEEESPRICYSDSQYRVYSQQKYGTLGSVIRKASNKFARKESDVNVRNSKSLPRDASRISATDSIRSILDDCQSSASSVIRKSRSLLKNTQSIFKSISQSRVSPGTELGHGTEQKKLSPSESDVSAVERKFSGFLKKEDFTKAKNVLKGKVEKVLKNFDTVSSSVEKLETTIDKKNLQVMIRNKSNLQVEKLENFKKWLPKSPQLYKSQFVRSQTSVQALTQESEQPTSNLVAVDKQKNTQTLLSTPIPEDNRIPNEEKVPQEEPQITESENAVPLPEAREWVHSREDMVQSVANEELNLNEESRQPDFIVMETIQGLPASDLESPSSEKENYNVENTGVIQTGKEEYDSKKVEASNSLQEVSDVGRDVAPCFPEIDEEKGLTKAPSEKKIKPKKKFTARFRSFWCSTFGRVKTPPKKGDLS